MFMRFSTLVLFILLAFGSRAQNIDSLSREVKNGNKTEKFYAALELAKIYSSYRSSPTPLFKMDSARYYIAVMEKLPRRKPDMEIGYNQLLGWYYAYSDIVKSIEYLKAALELAKKLRDKEQIGDAYLILAETYNVKVDFGPALQNYFNALNMYKILGSEKKIRDTYEKIADMLFLYKHIEKSIEYYELSLKNLYGNKEKGVIYNKIANSYLLTNNYEKSKEYCFKALQSLGKEPVKTELSLSYNILGKIYFEKKDYNTAIGYYKKALEILSQRESSTETTMAAASYDSYEVTAYLGLGNIYVLTGDIANASLYLNAGKNKAERITPDLSLMEIYHQLYVINEKLGNKDLAYTYLQKGFDLANGFFVSSNSGGFAQNLIQVYEAEQKENLSIVRLQDENEQQRRDLQQQSENLRYLLVLAGILLVIMGAFYYRYKERKRISHYLEQQVESRTQELKAQSQEKTLMLKEIHHRVKNNLQLISSFLNLQRHYATNKPADLIISETQERVRCMAIIHEKLYSAQSLAKLDTKAYLTEIASYVHQSYISTSSRINMVINIDSVIMPLDKMIPCGLILNELISNSFKYGFKDREEGEIRVDFHDNNGERCFSVCDNGIGMPPDFNLDEVNSLGMNIVVGLIEQLDGILRIESQGGSCFYIRFS
jgi:two-component sensor histidine kinase